MEITLPPGTIAVLHKGHILSELDDWLREQPRAWPVVKVRGNQIARGRNVAAARMTGDYLLFVDSDVVPPPDALYRLVAADVDIASGVVPERFPAFEPCLQKTFEPPTRWTLADLPKTGLLRVPAAGTGCLLIRRRVLETVPTPWFRCGQLVPDLLMEDTDFCLRAGEAGFATYAVCDVRCGHEVSGILWPGKDGRMWIEWPGPGTYRVPLNMDPLDERVGRR